MDFEKKKKNCTIISKRAGAEKEEGREGRERRGRKEREKRREKKGEGRGMEGETNNWSLRAIRTLSNTSRLPGFREHETDRLKSNITTYNLSPYTHRFTVQI